jgi:MoxR-like ATPase
MADIEALRSEVRSVTVEESIMGYITAIAQATRNNPSIDLGASPRASIGMLVASKARAVLEGRTFVIPDDVQMVARPVLRHRIQVSPEREMEGFTADQIIGDLLRSIDVPR